MNNCLQRLFSMIVIIGVCLITYPQNIQGVSYTVIPGPVGCIQTFNAGQSINGQTNIRFYNACPERMYINVCVLDTSGNTKLYKSGSRVMTNGNFTINTFPDQIPRFVAWTADPIQPLVVPDICKSPPQGWFPVS